MANPKHLEILEQGVSTWNGWRAQNPDIRPNLARASLAGKDLQAINLRYTDLTEADLSEANLERADLEFANLSNGKLTQVRFSSAKLMYTVLRLAVLDRANLEQANLRFAILSRASLVKAVCRDCMMTGVSVRRADLREADFQGANLRQASLVECKIQGARFKNCEIYGISAWNLHGEPQDQSGLIIRASYEDPAITVDSLEVAQFVFLLLTNYKIRQVVDTVTKTVVLILGRFTDKRKRVLDALRDTLRIRGYVPILYDFPSSPRRDLTETVQLLASLARFVIADLTEAKSIPQELSQIIPFLPSVPIQPIILASERKYALFEHWEGFKSVLPEFSYNNEKHLIQHLDTNVIHPVEAWERKQDQVLALKEEIKELKSKLAAKVH